MNRLSESVVVRSAKEERDIRLNRWWGRVGGAIVDVLILFQVAMLVQSGSVKRGLMLITCVYFRLCITGWLEMLNAQKLYRPTKMPSYQAFAVMGIAGATVPRLLNEMRLPLTWGWLVPSLLFLIPTLYLYGKVLLSRERPR